MLLVFTFYCSLISTTFNDYAFKPLIDKFNTIILFGIFMIYILNNLVTFSKISNIN